MTPRRILTTLFLAALMVLALAPAARVSAHAALAGSEPADGGMVATAPAVARLTFSEPVAPLVLRLLGPDGASAELTGATLQGDTLVVPLPPGLADGTHALSYRVMSADGHPVGGTLVFAVGDAPPVRSAGVAAEPADPARTAAIWAARTAFLAGALLGIGGALFLAFASDRSGDRRDGRRRFAAGALVLSLAAAPLSVGLHGLDALGLPLAALADGAPWAAGLGAPMAATAGLTMLAVVLAAVSLGSRGVVFARLFGLLALAVLAFAAALSGHAATAPPVEVTRRAVSVHVAAAAVWIGALVPLGAVIARGGDGETAALARFSRLIPYAVAALAVTGIFLAVVQVETPSALWTTAYGRVLIAKLALVLVLVALAAFNRFRLTRPALAGDAQARRRLVRVIAVEAMLSVAILGVVSLWRFTPPPRTIAAAASAPVEVHIHTEKAMATLSLSPGRAGPVKVEMSLATGDFGALPVKEVAVAFANPAAGIEPIRRTATEAGGLWWIDDLTLPVPGLWQVRIDVLVSDFETVRLDGTVTVAP